MLKLQGLKPLKNKLLINKIKHNIGYLMRFRRFTNGIDLKPEQFITIGKEFKEEMNSKDMNRAIEVLGKYNESTLSKILEYNSSLENANNSLNSQLSNTISILTSKKIIENKQKEENKSNENDQAKDKVNEKEKEKENDNSKNNNQKANNFQTLALNKSYQKLFTQEEINLIKEISAEKEKIITYLRTSSFTEESVILRNNFAFALNLSGKMRENKFFYILLAIFVFWMGYDAKGTLKCNIKFKQIFFFIADKF